MQYFSAPFKSMIIAFGLILLIVITNTKSDSSHLNRFLPNSISNSLVQIQGNNHKIHIPTERESNAVDSIHYPNITSEDNDLNHIINDLNINGYEFAILAVAISVLLCLFSLSSLILTFTQGIFAAAILLCTKKYPKWLYQWNKAIVSYYINFTCYNWFLIDKLPNLDGDNSQLKIELPNPENEDLSRFLPLIKWLLALVQLIFVSALRVLIMLAHILLWPYLCISGNQYPARLKAYMNGFFEWELSVYSYCSLLFTDEYPKFTFKSKFE